MTPFSAFLYDFCRSRGMRQKEFAYQIGVDPSYLSAIINGRKNTLGNSFAERIEERFELSEEEKLKLPSAGILSCYPNRRCLFGCSRDG
ncbi:helix-turn-helix domain-containing protein [Herbaspirillum huttiense]|uniref:helix-turn-helix domain-containing protein n=1 Tax=Herbaspirillum huttiense TaxID=863372 RepID=UPI00381636F3